MSIDYKTIVDDHVRFARKRFSHVMLQILLSDLLKNLFDVSLEDIVFGMEKAVKSKVKGFRGKTDLLYQSVVFEVKMDIDREKEDGEKQLRKYFQALHELDPDSKNVGLITDCIKFIEYIPVIENNEVARIREVSSIDLEKNNYRDAILWLDAIVFSKDKIPPSAEDLKFRFGIGSPTYAHIMNEIENAWDKIKGKEATKIKTELWGKHMEVVYGRSPTERSFLEQTFLVILVKSIVYLRLCMLESIKELAIHDALTGQYFRSFGISNLVEEGYYSWILDEEVFPQLSSSLENLLKELTKYDLDKIDEDLFKEIYQEIVQKEDRHRVGEYYTPEWIAELTLSEAFRLYKLGKQTTPKTPTLLDPACGSGTFLTNAITFFKQELQKVNPSEALHIILENIEGADINPLAVYIARANYIFALGELLSYRSGVISIPIYVSDTFQVENIEDIRGAAKGIYRIEADSEAISIPYSVLTDPTKFREAIRQFERAIMLYIEGDSNRDALLIHLRNQRSVFTLSEIDHLANSLNSIFNLIVKDRDSIWVFVISNMLAPFIFGRRKFDIIVGNPPWITMRSIENLSYQDYVKSKVFEFQLIDSSDIQLFSNMEMATVFFNNCADIYLKEGGVMAFVMPRSILTGALHHVKFKGFRNPKLKLKKIFDFENVTPVFNIPSCSIICIKGEENSYPVPIRTYDGKLESKNLRLTTALDQMKIEDKNYSPPITEGRKSPYYDRFKMGARLAPRPFWFIDFVSHPVLKINPRTPKVKTTEEAQKQAKGVWKKVCLEGNVDSDYIFATLLSKDLLPFGHTEMRAVVVPASLEKGKFSLMDIKSLQETDSIDTANWLEEVESYWVKYRSIKDEKNFPSVLDRIDYQKLLTAQDHSKRFVLLYVASGTYIIASVIERRKTPGFKANKQDIPPKGFVVESKTWCYESNDEDEIHYLCSMLNSNVLTEAVEKLQTRGLWGARDIHRRPFLFNIPLFSSTNKDHIQLAHISKELHKMVQKFKKAGGKEGISSKRRRIQRAFSKELREIDKLVKKVLIL